MKNCMVRWASNILPRKLGYTELNYFHYYFFWMTSPSFHFLYLDQYAPKHSIWGWHWGGSVDCGVPAGEGDKQPVRMELWAWPGKWYSGTLGHSCGKEREVCVNILWGWIFEISMYLLVYLFLDVCATCWPNNGSALKVRRIIKY